MSQLAPGTLTGFLVRKPALARKFFTFSIVLYDQANELNNKSERDYFQELMLDRIVMTHGAFKRTTRDRTPEFDNLVARHMQEDTYLHTVSGPVCIHDVGVSDGRSCPGFVKAMQELFPERLQYTASDYSPFVYVLDCRTQPGYRLVVDGEDNPLQLVSPPFVFDLVREKPRHYRTIKSWVYYLWCDRVIKKFIACRNAHPLETTREKLTIIDRQFADLLGSNPVWKFMQYNVLDAVSDRYHIVRAMNVLNPGYFDERGLRKAVRNLIDSLHDGGLLVTGSNLDAGSQVDGGIYRRSAIGVECIARSGKGSPVEKIILDTEL